MSSAAVQTHLTPEEYLAWERKADTKHEYLRGEIIAMSGASRAHSLICETSLFILQIRNSVRKHLCQLSLMMF